MYRTATAMHRRGAFEPVVVFTDANLAEERALCDAAGVACHVAPPNTAPAIGTRRPPSLVARGLRRLSGRKGSLVFVPWHIARLRRLSHAARMLLARLRPDVVIVPNVELGRLIGAVVTEAKARGIRTVVIPYAWVTPVETLAVMRARNDCPVNGAIARWIARKYPRWCREGRLARPAAEIVAMELLRLPASNPWMPDALADIVAVDSEAMRRSYVEDGCIPEACFITGSATHDMMVSARATRPAGYVLSFLPADQTAHGFPGFEFRNYWEMLTVWIRTLAVVDPLPIVFSLHPRMRHLRARLRNELGIEVYDGDSADVIPGARFCVGMTSGVMRHAIACAKPVLYYDVYHYEMDEFGSVPSVVTVTNRSAFAAELRRLATDRDYLGHLEQAARIAAARWGRLDGHAMDRIEALITAKCLPAGRLPAR
jgi:hypothetical protein